MKICFGTLENESKTGWVLSVLPQLNLGLEEDVFCIDIIWLSWGVIVQFDM
jgi:hypothetical protein